MSRNAKIRSLSKSLKDGISPGHFSENLSGRDQKTGTFDDLAEDTGSHDCYVKIRNGSWGICPFVNGRLTS